jgi:hypothetical protein
MKLFHACLELPPRNESDGNCAFVGALLRQRAVARDLTINYSCNAVSLPGLSPMAKVARMVTDMLNVSQCFPRTNRPVVDLKQCTMNR